MRKTHRYWPCAFIAQEICTDTSTQIDVQPINADQVKIILAERWSRPSTYLYMATPWSHTDPAWNVPSGREGNRWLDLQ
jgi:hypothetical protein